eukprot:2733212-Pyramimonas_sp.AAC.1
MSLPCETTYNFKAERPKSGDSSRCSMILRNSDMNCRTFENRVSRSRLPPTPIRNEAPASDFLRLQSGMTL